MYSVYVLYSRKFNKVYVGFTSNLEKRLISHNELGKKGWTIKYRPWEIIYTEEFEDKKEAMRRENELNKNKKIPFLTHNNILFLHYQAIIKIKHLYNEKLN